MLKGFEMQMAPDYLLGPDTITSLTKGTRVRVREGGVMKVGGTEEATGQGWPEIR